MPSTFDKNLVIEILNNIRWSLDQITRRFRGIEKSDDFTATDLGLEKLDSICMQLINIGEALKHIDKLTGDTLLPEYTGIDWTGAKGMRDIITHHYFDIDTETVYGVCTEHVPQMRLVIDGIITDLQNVEGSGLPHTK